MKPKEIENAEIRRDAENPSHSISKEKAREQLKKGSISNEEVMSSIADLKKLILL
jgi:hypothetical protein